MRAVLAYAIAVFVVTLSLAPAQAQTNYESWPVLKNPFPSTGGNNVMIDKYEPVVSGGKCTTDFTAIVEENFRRTAVARSVNQRVVDTIIETVSEQTRPKTYNRYGNSGLKQDMSLSLNLNQKA